MKNTYAVMLAAAGLLWVTGCSSTSSVSKEPVRTGFLSKYNHLEQVDASTWRYINYDRLGTYNKFVVSPVKVMATEFKGQALTDDQKRKASEFVHKAVVTALGDRYPVVTVPGADAAEIRIAVTETFKDGTHVGLTVEAEIIDTYSAVQVAAVMRVAEGEPHLAAWWDRPVAREIVEGFAKRLRGVIDNGHRR